MFESRTDMNRENLKRLLAPGISPSLAAVAWRVP